MSKIEIISVANGNKDFADLRARYLDGKQSMPIHTLRADSLDDLNMAIADFQKVANTMKVSEQSGFINVKKPDGTWETMSDYIWAATGIAEIIIEASRPKGGCPAFKP
tara:strand:+ start:165 stop:488 length:324 start_codon:yes stop_codon:yes gene_type:complete